jgi:hypothetical protein
MPLLEPWSRIRSLSFEGESTFAETDKASGETLSQPEPSRFKCSFADLQLSKARWEFDAGNRRWNSIYFPEPIRFRTEYFPRVHRWINGSAPFCETMATDVCDGISVFSEERSHPSGQFGRTRYSLDPFHHRRSLEIMILGLRALPPLLSIGHFCVIAEIDSREITAEMAPGATLPTFTINFPEARQEVKVTWDNSRHWFTKIESTRWGISAALLDLLRQKGDLNEEERRRLRTESEIVETESYEASEFEEAEQAGIFFPRAITFIRDWRKTRETKSWRFKFWTANADEPDDLFRITIPADCPVNDWRTPR